MNKRFQDFKKSFLWWPLVIVIFVVILDQLSKIWTIAASEMEPSIAYPPRTLQVVVDGYFYLVDWRNTGAAWGIFENSALPLSMVSLAAFLYFTWTFHELTENITFRKFSWALLIGGIFGNFIDRFFRREVIDMLHVRIPMPSFLHKYDWVDRGMYPFPAFNIADSAICVGVFLYFFHSVFFSKKKKSSDSPSQEDNVQKTISP